MIREILHLILTGGLTHTSEIAGKMGIQDETLNDILQLLQLRGYLRLSKCAEDQMIPCSHCPTSGSCITTAQKSQTFIVTESGKCFAKSFAGSVTRN